MRHNLNLTFLLTAAVVGLCATPAAAQFARSKGPIYGQVEAKASQPAEDKDANVLDWMITTIAAPFVGGKTGEELSDVVEEIAETDAAAARTSNELKEDANDIPCDGKSKSSTPCLIMDVKNKNADEKPASTASTPKPTPLFFF